MLIPSFNQVLHFDVSSVDNKGGNFKTLTLQNFKDHVKLTFLIMQTQTNKSFQIFQHLLSNSLTSQEKKE